VAHGFLASDGQYVVHLADDQGNVAPISAKDLAGMVARQRRIGAAVGGAYLQLVLLASCHSGEAPLEQSAGLAERIVSGGVPTVIAMQDVVAVATAREYTEHFYVALARCGLPEVASNVARALLISGGREGYAAPVVFSSAIGHLDGGPPSSDVVLKDLVRSLQRGACLPFLGPHINDGWLLSKQEIARTLGGDAFPIPNAPLERVAQLSVSEALKESYADILKESLWTAMGPVDLPRDFQAQSLNALIHDMGWAARSQSLPGLQVHHLLANLPIPLYISTTRDVFLEEALGAVGKSPLSLQPNWRPPGQPTAVLGSPNVCSPSVFHLNGLDLDSSGGDHLMLSEDEFAEHLVSVAHGSTTGYIPEDVLERIQNSNWVFVGFDLDDWEFRVVFYGLLRPIWLAQSGKAARKRRAWVQVDAPPWEHDRIERNLNRFCSDYDLTPVWDSPESFLEDLHGYWQQARLPK
jgi:hypothetical protein